MSDHLGTPLGCSLLGYSGRVLSYSALGGGRFEHVGGTLIVPKLALSAPGFASRMCVRLYTDSLLIHGNPTLCQRCVLQPPSRILSWCVHLCLGEGGRSCLLAAVNLAACPACRAQRVSCGTALAALWARARL